MLNILTIIYLSIILLLQILAVLVAEPLWARLLDLFFVLITATLLILHVVY